MEKGRQQERRHAGCWTDETQLSVSDTEIVPQFPRCLSLSVCREAWLAEIEKVLGVQKDIGLFLAKIFRFPDVRRTQGVIGVVYVTLDVNEGCPTQAAAVPLPCAPSQFEATTQGAPTVAKPEPCVTKPRASSGCYLHL
jgi:hypothetical protein